MAISKYNFSLDYMTLALASAVNGDLKNAGKLMLQASKQPDAKRAVEILEASAAMAFDNEQAKVTAAAKAKTAKTKTEAAKRLSTKTQASKAPAGKTQVKAFDLGDDAAIEDLVGDDDEVVEDVDEEVEAAEETDEDDAEFNEQFATIMAGMTARSKK